MNPDQSLAPHLVPQLTIQKSTFKCLSEIMSGKTEEMNVNSPPGAIPTSAFTVV